MRKGDFQLVKLSNSERRRKREGQTCSWKWGNKPRAYYKCFSYLQKPVFMRKFGYDYESDNSLLAELKESFEAKCDLYYNKMRDTKLSSYQKRQLKERISFKPEYNPVLAMFKTLDDKLVKDTLQQGFQAIQSTSQQWAMIQEGLKPKRK